MTQRKKKQLAARGDLRRQRISLYGAMFQRDALVHGLMADFEADAKVGFFARQTVTFLFLIMLGFSWAAVTGQFNFTTEEQFTDDDLDKMAVMVDFGDLKPLQKQSSGRRAVVVDEVFGNKYVKDKEKIDPNAREVDSDPYAGAMNPGTGAATPPVDLSPQIVPQYTAEARNAGIEGTIVLEIVLSEEGRVLRARPVGRKLGHGLEQSAIAAFKAKEFKPSISHATGKPILVKFYQPVRFVLFE